MRKRDKMKSMTGGEIRTKFLQFFKKRGHTIVPSASLLPTDPSVLFTTAGMQQFKPYYTGDADAMRDFKSLNTVSIQKCLRTSDIDEIGDESHLTFFEMLGNFSFGGYFKKEAIEYAYEFIVKEMGLAIDYVSVFGGENDIPEDVESAEIWKSLDPNITIKKCGRQDNFWGPTGEEGPCGPTTEVYVNGVEIWNIVFNQYYCQKDKSLEPLKTPGIDTGMGLERLATLVEDKSTVFDTDLFQGAFGVYSSLAGDDLENNRIFMDHTRSVVFLIADGVRPSNKEAGYILRRLIRRIITIVKIGGHIPGDILLERIQDTLNSVITYYENYYNNLKKCRNEILEIFKKEFEAFTKTFERGLREFFTQYPELRLGKKLTPGGSIKDEDIHKSKVISGKDAFYFHQTYGLTIDIIKDLAKRGFHMVDEEGFRGEFRKHQEKSRAGAEKKFGGHGLILDTGELKAADEKELVQVTKLHTATHLLHAALRQILGDQVQQAGSDITAERLRFDFTFPRKLTPDELVEVENLVNWAIQQDFPVTKEEMPYEEALQSGALHFFKEKYPDTVSVYSVGDFSKELCGGPHVTHTGVIGRFTIVKEESVGSGVRRIRATVQ